MSMQGTKTKKSISYIYLIFVVFQIKVLYCHYIIDVQEVVNNFQHLFTSITFISQKEKKNKMLFYQLESTSTTRFLVLSYANH